MSSVIAATTDTAYAGYYSAGFQCPCLANAGSVVCVPDLAVKDSIWNLSAKLDALESRLFNQETLFDVANSTSFLANAKDLLSSISVKVEALDEQLVDMGCFRQIMYDLCSFISEMKCAQLPAVTKKLDRVAEVAERVQSSSQGFNDKLDTVTDIAQGLEQSVLELGKDLNETRRRYHTSTNEMGKALEASIVASESSLKGFLDASAVDLSHKFYSFRDEAKALSNEASSQVLSGIDSIKGEVSKIQELCEVNLSSRAPSQVLTGIDSVKADLGRIETALAEFRKSDGGHGLKKTLAKNMECVNSSTVKLDHLASIITSLNESKVLKEHEATVDARLLKRSLRRWFKFFSIGLVRDFKAAKPTHLKRYIRSQELLLNAFWQVTDSAVSFARVLQQQDQKISLEEHLREDIALFCPGGVGRILNRALDRFGASPDELKFFNFDSVKEYLRRTEVLLIEDECEERLKYEVISAAFDVWSVTAGRRKSKRLHNR